MELASATNSNYETNMNHLRHILLLLGGVLMAFSLAGCFEDKEDLEDIFEDRGREWKIVNHCSEFEQYSYSKIQFNGDGGGLYVLLRDCEVGGTECTDANTFDWEADDENGTINIVWRSNYTSVLVCSENPGPSYQTPLPESFSFSEGTKFITVRGHTWKND